MRAIPMFRDASPSASFDLMQPPDVAIAMPAERDSTKAGTR